MERVVAGFQLLGLRLSNYNLKNSILRFDSHLNDNMVNFKKTFLIALTEEIMANRIALKNGLFKNVLPAK